MIEVNAGFASMSPPLVRLLLNQVRISLGENAIPNGSYFEASVPMSAAWENCGVAITGTDMAAAATSIAGVRLIVRFDVPANHFVFCMYDEEYARLVNVAIPNGY